MLGRVLGNSRNWINQQILKRHHRQSHRLRNLGSGRHHVHRSPITVTLDHVRRRLNVPLMTIRETGSLLLMTKIDKLRRILFHLLTMTMNLVIRRQPASVDRRRTTIFMITQRPILNHHRRILMIENKRFTLVNTLIPNATQLDGHRNGTRRDNRHSTANYPMATILPPKGKNRMSILSK